MNTNIELSFCIPTYNNAKSLYRLVSSILESDDSNIEVVVLDNGSTDETLSLLESIKDVRLSVYSNGINKGALFNMMNVLDKGCGQYLVYCTDHDHVSKDKINRFRNYLVGNSKVAFGYCLYHSNTTDCIEQYNPGFESLYYLGYITRHPTGFFFKKEFWKEIDSVNRFSDYEYVDLFPLEFVFAELSFMGNGVVYHDSIFSPETGERVIKHKSATTRGNSKSAFFAPECRLKLAKSFSLHILSLGISSEEKRLLQVKSFVREFYNATITYKGIMKNEKLCLHYNMARRDFNFIDLFKIGYKYLIGYYKQVYLTQNLGFCNRSIFVISLLKYLSSGGGVKKHFNC